MAHRRARWLVIVGFQQVLSGLGHPRMFGLLFDLPGFTAQATFSRRRDGLRFANLGTSTIAVRGHLLEISLRQPLEAS